MSNQKTQNKPGLFNRFIKGIEVLGNKLPHPFWIFVYLIVAVFILSAVLSSMGVSVTYMAANSKGGAAAEKTVKVVNLFSYAAMRPFFSKFVKTYINFTPLGLVLVMMLGIGLIEQTGLISALMRKTLLGAPSHWITLVFSFIAVNANLASNAGSIFMPAIGAAVFKALGRNPWIGVILGFAGASGGFTANFFVAGTDALLAGITESAAKSMNISAPMHPLINWYFLASATLVLTVVLTLVTEKFLVRYLDPTGEKDSSDLEQYSVTGLERRGLRWAGWTALACVAVLLALTLPEGSFFRSDKGTILPSSPFMSSIVPNIFFLFFFVGIAYGYGAKSIRNKNDIPKMMQKSLGGALTFMVISFPAAMFIELFEKSCLTTVMAVKGAELLKAMNLGGIPLLIMFILLCSIINLFITSGGAKWLILAPIFVPMFSILGYSPALTQLAYRIGDSSSNIISPLYYAVPVCIGLMDQYRSEKEKDVEVGIGTVLSLEMPFSIAIFCTLTLMLIVWYLLGLPIGPGTPLML